ncbi:uncharacterized protein BXZ73DRAFT_98683 [Epithele typhae]|uniref:uncharacterized protein n=1 Tax=Epithele typhae TaxID=378194 RepID=UPI0020083BBC|nr:uncharacterized protein BXZ73DRAFT_98683 [Epithele typhae]KAH9940850.1 hypothetical protein BXZ73DRAFT_98683 [Epithele typhae]
MQGNTTTSVLEESEELVRFRQQWLEEVRSKKHHPPTHEQSSSTETPGSSAPASADAGSSSSAQEPPASPTAPHHRPHVHRPPRQGADVVTRGPKGAVKAQFSPSLKLAVDMYRHAVQQEQKGDLDDALRLYRNAFRMDANVDRAYHLVENEALQNAVAVTAAVSEDAAAAVKTHKKTGSTGSAGEVDGLVREMEGLGLSGAKVPVAHARGEGFVTGTLAQLVSGWPTVLAFEADEEQEGVPLQKLPDELLIIVVRMLDHTTIERFANVNRKARVITLDVSIWRPMVKTIYRPPMIADDEEIETLVTKYMTDWRRVYVEHPRVRYDGVYIAVCHYVRNGVGENVWVNYSHLITYYRFLRFYPDGQVLSLLTNEEQAPSQVIPLLKPSHRAKGFLIGKWYIDGTELHVGDLTEPDKPESRYTFQMLLDLRSRPVGRWNRLDLRTYDSVSVGSGDASPLALKNERPYWFSKVRSYAWNGRQEGPSAHPK